MAVPRLLVAESLDGVELGGARGGIWAGNQTDHHGENNGPGSEPQRQGHDCLGGQVLAL